MSLELENRRTIVTGAAMGIGRAIATRFVAAGAAVLLVDINAEKLAETAASMPPGSRVASIVADLGDPDAPERIVASCDEQLGPVDILVNNAGIFPLYYFGEFTADAFDAIMAVNLRGAILLAQSAGQSMVTRGGPGAMINISAVGGRVPAAPGLLMYVASKYALLSVTRSLALELAPYKIRVNAVSPGPVATEGSAVASGVLTPEEVARREEMRARFDIPWGRIGEPSEIADAVLFLASDASGFITGSDLVVDGGMLLR